MQLRRSHRPELIAARVCDGGSREVEPRILSFLAVIGVALAVAVAVGAIGVPDVPDAVSDLGGWIYPALLAFVFLETTMLLGFLIHGELVLMVAGVAAANGDVSLLAMIALAWMAAVTGDVVSLRVGRRLGRPFLERHGRRMRLRPEQLARMDGFFARHGGKALFLGRFSGFSRATMPFVVGSSGMAVRRLLPFSVASGLVWTATFTVIGYAAAESFENAGETATRAATAVLLLAVAALLVRSRVSRWRTPREMPRRGDPATGDPPAG
jgi:membrane protein DedA with SNARE-associated domain